MNMTDELQLNNKGVIYKITSPTGKVYIGQTIELNKRITKYRNYLCKSQVILYRSLMKHGFDKHLIETVEKCAVTELDNREIYWINKLQLNRCKYQNGIGLNMCDGGKSVRGIVRTQAHKDAISKANKGRVVTEEMKQRLKVALTGKTHTYETKLKMSETRKGHLTPEETKEKIANAQGKKVLDTATGIIYIKCKDAAKVLGIKDATLRSWLRGDRPNKSTMIYV